MERILSDPDVVLKDAHESSKIVHEHYIRSRDFLVADQVPLWVENYKAYRSFVELDEEEGGIRSGLFRPLIFGAVETILPRMVMNLPRIEVWGRNKEDEVRADRNRSLIFYDWDIMDMAFQLVNWAKSAQVFNIGWFKVVYKKEIRTRRGKKPRIVTLPNGMQFTLGKTSSVEKRTVYDDPCGELLDADEVFPEPEAKDEQKAAYMIHRRVADIFEIDAARLEGKPLYRPKIVKELKALMSATNPKSSGDGIETIEQQRRTTFASTSLEDSPDPYKAEIHLLEHWTDSKVTVVVEEFPQLEPLRDDYHDYGMKPFCRYTPVPLPNEMYGLSVPEILYSLNLEINTLANARVDALLQNVYRMMSVIKGSINPALIEWQPGGYFFVNSHDDYAFAQPPPVEVGNYRETTELRMWAQWAGPATDTFAGLNTGMTGGTATEAALLQQASASRTGLMLQILGNQALRPMGRLLVRINEEHITEEKQLRVAGDYFQKAEYLTVKPDELIAKTGVDLDVVIDVAETEPGNRQFRLSRSIAAIQALQNYLPPNHPILERFLAEMARAFGVENPEKAIVEGRQLVEQFARQNQGGQEGKDGQEKFVQKALATGDVQSPQGDRVVEGSFG